MDVGTAVLVIDTATNTVAADLPVGYNSFDVGITPPRPPTANAGIGQVVKVGVLVTLDGSNSSDPNNVVPLSYAWTLATPAGSNAALSNPAIVNPTFMPDVFGTYTA